MKRIVIIGQIIVFVIVAGVIGYYIGSAVASPSTVTITVTKVQVAPAPSTYTTATVPIYTLVLREIDVLRIAISSDIRTLDIHYAMGVADFQVLGGVFESLFKIDIDPSTGKLVYIPWLVESYREVNSTYLIFNLRKGVKFHNGRELTSEDVRCSLLRAARIGPIGGVLLRDAEGGQIIRDVVTLNSTTFVLVLNRPFYPLFEHLAHLATAIMPREICEKYSDSPINEIEDAVGTGPYRLVSYEKGVRIRLERFDEYWGGKTAAKTVEYLVLPDPQTRIAALESGQVDIVVGIDPDQVPILMSRGFRIYNVTGVRLVLVAINVNRVPDVRIRLAMNYAIDKKKIVESIMRGYAYAAASIASPVFPGIAVFEPYEYNVTKALELLRSAGGFNKTLTLLVSTAGAKDREIAELVQSYLQRIGLRVEIEMMEQTAFLKRVFQDHDFDLAIYGPSPSSLYYALSYWRTGSALNGPNYSNPVVDELLNAVANEFDPERRQSLLTVIQWTIWSDAPAIWLFYQNVLFASKPGIEIGKIYPFQNFDIRSVRTVG